MLLNINRNLFQNFPFHLVSISPWPILVSFSLLSLTMGAVLSMHGYGNFTFLLGVASTGLGMLLWFRDIILEAFSQSIVFLVLNFIISMIVSCNGIFDIQNLGLFLFTVNPTQNVYYRFVHTASSNKDNNDAGGTDGDNDDNSIALKNEFDNHPAEWAEAKYYSEEMFVSEYLEETMSSFEEAFPKLYQDSQLKLLLNKQSMEMALKDFLQTDDLSKVTVAELLLALENQPGSTLFENFTSVFNDFDFSKVNPEDVNQRVAEVNSSFEKDMGEYVSNKTTKAIEMTNDQLIINLPVWRESYEKIYSVFKDNYSKLEVTGKIGLFGITNLLMYRTLLRVYDRDKSVDLSNLKSDKAKVKVIKIYQKNRYNYSTYGALVVMSGINTMYFASKYFISSKVTIEANTSSYLTNIKKFSFLLIFGKNKIKNTILFLFLILILSAILMIVLPFILPLIEFLKFIIISNLIYFKIILAGMLNVTILVNILEIFIINKYSKLKEEPKYNKNIPEFIIKELQNLFEISKLEELAKEIILNNMLKTLIYLIILDILLIIIIFITILIT